MSIEITRARENIVVTLPHSQYLSAAIGTSAEDILLKAQSLGLIEYDSLLIAAIVDGKLRELSYEIVRDVTIHPVLLSSSDGGRIYRRSLIMLMVTAMDELWPGTQISVEHAVPDGGYYCRLNNRDPLTDLELQQLQIHMEEIVAADEPIIKSITNLAEIREEFARRGHMDKVRLLDFRVKNTLTTYTLRNYTDYYYGYMLSRTSYLKLFKLIHINEAFILQYPRAENPNKLKPLKAYAKLSTVFLQSNKWLSRLKVEDIGRLNHRVKNNQIHELMLISEAIHERNVASIALEIRERFRNGLRLVLISGPTSSGKTTFSKRLAIQLMAMGLRPFTLEMDNYFVDRELTPRDANGEYDFESIDALELDLLQEHLGHLIEGRSVIIPKFDFISGTRVPNRTVQLANDQIIIVEGIHGLNPKLVNKIPSDRFFRIYISALTQLNIDSHNRVPTTDVRLLRRIVRDARTRGYNATDTLTRWRSVRIGEKRHIFPYQENADMMFNSALIYELSALKPFAEPLLLQVEPGTAPHIEANRLLSFLGWVTPLTLDMLRMIPDTSLLREFIGNSVLEDYHPGETLNVSESDD